MPVISVIIPAYNGEHTILETIQSVQNQTFSDFEIIVIDDGSTDRTLELLYSIKDDRLKVFPYSNGGVATSRNRGIAQASGEFLTFLDQDDLWAPDKLALQLEALLQHPEAGVAYSWTYFMEDRDGQRLLHKGESLFFEGDVYPEILVHNFIASGSNVLVRKSAIDEIGGFDCGCPDAADWDYWLRLAAKWPFVVVPQFQIYYRRSSNSMSSKTERVKQACFLVLNKAYQAAPAELQHLKQKSLAWVYRYFTELNLRYSTDVKGVEQGGLNLYQAITLQPSSLLDEHTQRLLKWFIKRWLHFRFPALARL